MYMSEISASQTVAFSDVVSNAKEYDDFRADASTVTLYDTEAQIIAQQRMQESVMETRPQLTYFKDMQDASTNFTVFGIPILFKDYKQDVLVFDPVLDVREAIEMTNEEKEASFFYNEISFQYIFEKKTFTFNYYTIGDLFTELCGIGNGIAGVLSQYTIYIIMLFAIQLNYLAKQKHKKDYEKYRYESLLRKIPSYRLVIEKQLRDKFMTKEGKKSIKKAEK